MFHLTVKPPSLESIAFLSDKKPIRVRSVESAVLTEGLLAPDRILFEALGSEEAEKVFHQRKNLLLRREGEPYTIDFAGWLYSGINQVHPFELEDGSYFGSVEPEITCARSTGGEGPNAEYGLYGFSRNERLFHPEGFALWGVEQISISEPVDDYRSLPIGSEILVEREDDEWFSGYVWLRSQKEFKEMCTSFALAPRVVDPFCEFYFSAFSPYGALEPGNLYIDSIGESFIRGNVLLGINENNELLGEQVRNVYLTQDSQHEELKKVTDSLQNRS